MTADLVALRRPIAGVAGIAPPSLDVAELGITDATRALGRCHTCKAGRLGLVWRRRNGVTLADVRCPICAGRVVQTTNGLRATFYVLTDDYVAACAAAIKADRKAAQDARIAAGAAKLARDLQAGDVVRAHGATVRVIGPSSRPPSAGTRVTFDVAVEAGKVRRHQPWSVITIEPRKTEELPLLDGAGRTWADLAPGAAMLAMARAEVDTYSRMGANARRDASTYGTRVAGEVRERATGYEALVAEAQAIVDVLEAAELEPAAGVR